MTLICLWAVDGVLINTSGSTIMGRAAEHSGFLVKAFIMMPFHFQALQALGVWEKKKLHFN